MPVSPPNVMLKVIWLTHFILSSWALMSDLFSVQTYWFTQLGVLAFGFWAIVSSESVDAALMFLLTLLFSIINDIILLALYEPRGHDFHEKGNVSESNRNEYRFALGMSIVNLILKPFSGFLVFRIYQSRAQGTDFSSGIPGLDGSPAFGGSRGNYDNIEEGGYGKPGEPPQYQAPNYQEPPSGSS